MPTITVELPDGLSLNQLVRAAHAIEDAAKETVGVLCETNIDISDLEPARRLAHAAPDGRGGTRSRHGDPLAPRRDISRAQECAADAMAAKHGRSRVRHLADGAVEITGMLDDIERETVCIEQDGRERWRR